MDRSRPSSAASSATIRDGDRFGKLGVDLCERLNDVTVRSACHFTWAAFASRVGAADRREHRGIPRRRALGPGRAAIIRTRPTAPRCAITHVMFAARRSALTRDAGRRGAGTAAHASATSTNVALLRSRRRFIDWLHAPTGGHSLDDDGVRRGARRCASCRPPASARACWRTSSRCASCIATSTGSTPEAWTHLAAVVDDLLVYVPGMMTVVEHAFFQCLSADGAVARRLPGDRTRRARGAPRGAAAEHSRPGRRSCPAEFRAAAPDGGGRARARARRDARRRRTLRACRARGARQPLPARRGDRQRARHASTGCAAMRHARQRCANAPSPRTTPGARCARRMRCARAARSVQRADLDAAIGHGIAVVLQQDAAAGRPRRSRACS